MSLLAARNLTGLLVPNNAFYLVGIRLYSVAPPKPVITIPLTVEKRALKRYRNIQKVGRELDRERLKSKISIITCKRPELNHHMGQTYGKFDTVPLASQGWMNRKSYDDFFSINQFLPNRAKSFAAKLDEPPTFKQLDIHPSLVAALENCGYTKLTNIQHEALPKMLENQEFHTLIAAETGNGKTLCFLIPIIQNILALKGNPEQGSKLKRPYNSPLGVVVAPSRELAAQIGTVARKLCSQLGIHVEVAQGGSVRSKILNSERREVDLLIGSLGGLSKFFIEGLFSRKYVMEIALDEIDTLVDDTFKESLISFLRKFGHSAVSLLSGVRISMTGATFPTSFDAYMSEILDVEEILKISTDQIHRIQFHVPQKFIRVAPSRKLNTLMEIIHKDLAKQKKTLIFSNKGSTADFLNYHLNENNVVSINFDQNVPWRSRMEHLQQFTHGQINVLSATDLASRGLDTSMVNHVINYDFPLNVADYIHRAGRVGRVGGTGSSHVTSLVDHPLGIEVLQRIETSVRKNTEILNVNNNIIRIIQHRQRKKEQQGLS